MACVLSDSPTIDADYQGAIGATFTVDAVCDDATVAVAVSAASYAGTTLTAAPFTFTIRAGTSSLATIVEGSTLNAHIKVVEVCPAGGNFILRNFDLTDPDHSISSVRIKGV